MGEDPVLEWDPEEGGLLSPRYRSTAESLEPQDIPLSEASSEVPCEESDLPWKVHLPGGHPDFQSGSRLHWNPPSKTPPELPAGWVVSGSQPQCVGGVGKEALPIDVKT